LRRIGERLAEQPGVTKVTTNPTTGSVVVNYDPNQLTHDDVLSMLHDIGCVIHEAIEPGSEDEPEEDQELPGARRSQPATRFMGSIDRLDRRLGKLTGHSVNLRLLFPTTLGVVGALKIATEGLGLAEVPGIIMLWYAFDSFWKLHTELPPEEVDDAQSAVTPPATEATRA
jgi:copper chaperone CopZ